ncbi:hypothetical protein HDU96_006158 [Phlyctochytrium bullatum]|nr:hypothetical protein HDU96_006158 [Phlyctochytrium bullatum]
MEIPPRSASSEALPDLASSGLIPLYKIPSKGRLANANLAFNKDEPIQFTRESFAKVMVDSRLYAAFVDYVEREHCGENIQFYQELSKLEDLIASCTLASSIHEAATYESARSAGATHALARFLRAAAAAAAAASTNSLATTATVEEPTTASSVLTSLPPLPSTPAPPSLRRRYLELYNTFIAQGSPQEINVTDATRRRIANALAPVLAISSVASGNALQAPSGPPSSQPSPSAGGETGGTGANDDAPPATVFDAAGDEIVDLLYRDTFKRFVGWHAKNGLTGSSMGLGASGETASPAGSAMSSSRPSHDGKRRPNKNEPEEQFEDPMEDLTPDLAMMLLAQAALQAEEARSKSKATAPSSGSGTSTPKKLAFWRRKKVDSNSASANTSAKELGAVGGGGGGGVSSASGSATNVLRGSSSISNLADPASATGMPSPPMSRRSSTSSQASSTNASLPHPSSHHHSHHHNHHHQQHHSQHPLAQGSGSYSLLADDDASSVTSSGSTSNLSSSGFSKPTNAGRRKNSLFGSKAPSPPTGVPPPVPSPSQLPSNPPMMTTKSSPGSSSSSSSLKPVNTSPRPRGPGPSSLQPLDVSDTAIRRPEDTAGGGDVDLGDAAEAVTAAPKSAGWNGFRMKTPTATSNGSWFGRKNSVSGPHGGGGSAAGSRQELFVAPADEAANMPALPEHLRKGAAAAGGEGSLQGSPAAPRKKMIPR